MKNKNEQLGMNASTAAGRLIKDLLFSFIVKEGLVCYRCSQPLTRDTFSVEHKVPWLHSENPTALFFDINNIAYSHLICNSLAGRKYKTRQDAPHGTNPRYSDGCRCQLCKDGHALHHRQYYTAEKRRARYLKTGY